MLDLYKSSRVTSRKNHSEGENSFSFLDNSVNKWIKMSLERIEDNASDNHSEISTTE